MKSDKLKSQFLIKKLKACLYRLLTTKTQIIDPKNSRLMRSHSVEWTLVSKKAKFHRQNRKILENQIPESQIFKKFWSFTVFFDDKARISGFFYIFGLYTQLWSYPENLKWLIRQPAPGDICPPVSERLKFLFHLKNFDD